MTGSGSSPAPNPERCGPARVNVRVAGNTSIIGGRAIVDRVRSAPICLFLLLAACFAGSEPQEQKPTDIEFCRLVTHPKDFNGKQVRVMARVETTVIEGGTWLGSPLCEQRSVELIVPDQIRSHPEEYPGYKALADAILFRGNIGTVGKSITATFTGTFTARSRKPKLVLTIGEVHDLDVKLAAPR